MTQTPPDEGTPAPTTPNYEAVINEQKAILAAMNDKIKALESKNSDLDAKITALSKPAAEAKPEAKVEEAKSKLDEAYEKILAELGIKKE